MTSNDYGRLAYEAVVRSDPTWMDGASWGALPVRVQDRYRLIADTVVAAVVADLLAEPKHCPWQDAVRAFVAAVRLPADDPFMQSKAGDTRIWMSDPLPGSAITRNAAVVRSWHTPELAALYALVDSEEPRVIRRARTKNGDQVR